MKPMVAGLAFDYDMNFVVLLEKNRPEILAGLLMPVGGKIEEGEHPREAMIREFQEEAGVTQYDWEYFLHMTYPKEDISVYFYRTFSNDVLRNVYTATDEEVDVYKIHDLPMFPVVGNSMPCYKNFPHKKDLPVAIEIARMMYKNPAAVQMNI